ncbi:hypothetical protein ABBQ38_15545 [Trebouxia sp. C0009 RCD-2024]
MHLARFERIKQNSRASTSGSGSNAEPHAKRLKQPTIQEMITDKHNLDLKVAEFLYATGVPLHIVRSPYFKEMCEEISRSYVPYSGPAYNALRTTLLEQVKARVSKACKPWEDHAREVTGFVLVSDGWTDAQHRPLINFLLTSPKGQKFLRAVDTSGETKDGKYIAAQLTAIMEEVGPEDVIAVIMDGASNNVSANQILMERFPWLFTLHCTAHSLDLACEKLGGFTYFKDHIAMGKKVIRVLTNHHFTSALFKTQSKLFLLKPGDTRFYSAYIAVRRLLLCKNAVQKTVVSTEWASWADKAEYKNKASTVSRIVLNASFWIALARFIILLRPIVRLLRLVDSNMPSMSKVYPECCEIEKHIQNVSLPADMNQEVADIFRDRWDKLHSPLHALGYLLEPQFQGAKLGAEVKADYRKALKKMLSSTEYTKALSEITKFSNKEGVFGDPDIMSLTDENHPDHIPTYQFWAEYGELALCSCIWPL